MYKLVLSVSLVSVMLVATGYYLFSSGFSELKFAQYLPNSLSSYFQDESTEVIELESSEVRQDEAMTAVTKEPLQTKEQVADKGKIQETVEDHVQEINSDITFEPTTESAMKETPVVSADTDIIKPNLQKINNEADGSEIDKPKELVKLESELDEKNTSMDKLDDENEQLQQKFMDMLKQNKDLAIQLSQIEDKIKSKN